MQLIVHHDWKVCDGSKRCGIGIIPEGNHEVEVIDPPVGASDRDKRKFHDGSEDSPDYQWLVLLGTLIGASIAFWKMWSSPGLGIHQVKIIEDDQKLP